MEKKLIMDPRQQDLSRHAYKHTIQKHGKDVALLLNSMIYTIIEEKLYDEQYVASMTEGFKSSRKY